MITRREALGLAILAFGLLPGGLALAMLVAGPGSVAGNPGAVEASLGPTIVTSPPTTVPSGPSSETTAAVSPLWKANEPSPLGEASDETPLPSRLRIGAIGVDAPIEAMGVDRRTGEMELPATVREVAWYRFGPSPGQPGSAVLAAHVDVRNQGPGVFFNLKALKPGDRIDVVFEDGETRRFEVAARSIYEKDELPLDTVFARQGAPVLTLITCGGGFNPSRGHYDSNVVVYAVPARSDDDAAGQASRASSASTLGSE